MKLRSLLLVLAAGATLTLSAFAQEPKTPAPAPTTPDQTQAQPQAQPAPADQTQTPAPPAAGQDQPAVTQDPTTADPDTSTDTKKSPQKIKHDGGRDDVDAIGNRKMGGLDWYSIESEIKLGKQYAQMIEQSMKLIQDPVVNEYVNRIGQNLVRNSDAKVPFTIKVVDADEINAMALPGGFFYVNSGLILAADDEAELAGVMAHEIAHVCARHATRGATRSQLANILTIPLIFVGGGIGYAARELAGIGLPMTFLAFSRGFEAEADHLGVEYMYKAGYDPNEFVNFFEKVQAQEKKKPGTLAKAFSTHPQTPDRIQKTQEEIATILPAKDQYIETTSEFNDVKARLASIENRRKIDDQNVNKPTLRRTAGNGPAGKDGDKKDDDRPTLKRRDN